MYLLILLGFLCFFCQISAQVSSEVSSQLSSQVSSQVRKELEALFFGSGGAGEEQGSLPESLVLWLSQRYVSSPDLQASLAALEMSILRNVSQQLELSQARTLGEAESQARSIVQTVTGTVHHATSTEGLSEEVTTAHFCCRRHISILIT